MGRYTSSKAGFPTFVFVNVMCIACENAGRWFRVNLAQAKLRQKQGVAENHALFFRQRVFPAPIGISHANSCLEIIVLEERVAA